MTDYDPPCTDCDGTGITIQTERRCACQPPAPAVPDDVAEIAETLRKATFTKGRMHGGIVGQTIEANMRSTFHEVSAWDLDQAADALEGQAAELAQTKAEIRSIQHPQSGGSWYREADIDRLQHRADQAEEKNRNLRAALERCLNFIDNTECELGMTLECGDVARAALQPTGDA